MTSKDRVRRLLLASLATIVLVLPATDTGDAVAIEVGQEPRPARERKTKQFEYVCPMHPEVTARAPGKCPKCDMDLVKKRKTGANSAF